MFVLFRIIDIVNFVNNILIVEQMNINNYMIHLTINIVFI